jgi:hypothetical protein
MTVMTDPNAPKAIVDPSGLEVILAMFPSCTQDFFSYAAEDFPTNSDWDLYNAYYCVLYGWARDPVFSPWNAQQAGKDIETWQAPKHQPCKMDEIEFVRVPFFSRGRIQTIFIPSTCLHHRLPHPSPAADRNPFVPIDR